MPVYKYIAGYLIMLKYFTRFRKTKEKHVDFFDCLFMLSCGYFVKIYYNILRKCCIDRVSR